MSRAHQHENNKVATTKKTVKKPAKAISSAGAKIGTRGRTFEGEVVKKFPTRVVIELERTVFMRKYERFYKKKTRVHARLPEGFDVSVGDLVRAQETRPLSKLIHFLVIENLTEKARFSKRTLKKQNPANAGSANKNSKLSLSVVKKADLEEKEE
jgi:small subunit ribosomal protein S17